MLGRTDEGLPLWMVCDPPATCHASRVAFSPVIALPGMWSPDHGHVLVDQVDEPGALRVGQVSDCGRQNLLRRRQLRLTPDADVSPVTWLCVALGRVGRGAVALIRAS
jgi:hypothetical protein